MSRTRKFFQSFDRYADYVSLTYKKSDRIETSAGGIASIIIFILLAYWVMVNIFFTVYDNGVFSTYSSISVTQQADGNFPQFDLNKHELFISYRVNTFLEGDAAEETHRYI